MPLIHGYTPKSIRTNVEREIRRGKAGGQAVAIAFEEARRAWRHAHPRGPYPAHLRGMRKKVRRRAMSSTNNRSGMRTTKTRLRSLAESIAQKTGKPIVLDKDATGYKLENAHTGAALSPRYSAGEMDAFLQGLWAALTDARLR